MLSTEDPEARQIKRRSEIGFNNDRTYELLQVMDRSCVTCSYCGKEAHVSPNEVKMKHLGGDSHSCCCGPVDQPHTARTILPNLDDFHHQWGQGSKARLIANKS